MKKTKLLAVILAVATLFTACSSRPEGAVAKVNGDYITKEEFNNEFELYRKMVYGQMSDEELNQDGGNGKTLRNNLASQVTDTLVMDKLVKAEFDKKKLEISEEDRKEAKDKLFEQAGGEENFKTQLETMGLTIEEMDAIIEKTLVQNAVRDNFIAENKKSEEEVNAYFEENKDAFVTYDVSHILVENEDEAKEIKKELDGGADFATIAKEKSIDTGSAQNGGDLGEITMQTNFVQPFLDAVKNMKDGETSDPIESDYGYHIIHVKEVKDSVEDHEEAIQNTLLAPEVNAYMQDLYEKADIEIYKPSLEESKTTSKEETEEVSEDESKDAEKPADTETNEEIPVEETEASESEVTE